MAQQYKFGMLEKVARGKLRTDNDLRVIIQGSDSQTGIGKTTLAIKLARRIDPEWNAKEKAFIDVREYINAHLDKSKGSALLLDEIEAGADSRRAMSQENVDLSQAWATMRARNMCTICTLPSISMLDNRMIELADYWVLVKRRGVAQPYQISVNDFNGKVRRKPLPGDEHITFNDLPSDDPDKEYLDGLKDDMLREGSFESLTISEHERRVEKAKEKARREKRNEMIRQLYEHSDMSTTELAEFDWVGVDQSNVSRIINSA